MAFLKALRSLVGSECALSLPLPDFGGRACPPQGGGCKMTLALAPIAVLSRTAFPQTFELALGSATYPGFLPSLLLDRLLFKNPVVRTLGVLCCAEQFRS